MFGTPARFYLLHPSQRLDNTRLQARSARNDLSPLIQENFIGYSIVLSKPISDVVSAVVSTMQMCVGKREGTITENVIIPDGGL